MAGSSGMLDDDTQERRETRSIARGRNAQRSEGTHSVARATLRFSSCRGGLHVALRVSPAISFTVFVTAEAARSFCRPAHNERAALRLRSQTLYSGSGDAATALLRGIFVALTLS